jgi:hypothetical protein
MKLLHNLIYPRFKTWKYSRKLVFSYTGDEIKLEADMRIKMIPPTSDPVAGYEGQRGSWVTVEDANGTILYRRIVNNLMPDTAEIFTKIPVKNMHHVKRQEKHGSFMVIVPDISKGAYINLFTTEANDMRPVKQGAEKIYSHPIITNKK